MRLPFLDRKKIKKEFFLTLILDQHALTAVLHESIDQKLLTLSTKEVTFGKTLDDVSSELLITSADKAISHVENSAPKGVFVKKTVFAIPHHWQKEGKILKTNLAKLKRVCDELDLTPVGFLVPIEAILSYMQEKEGAPISAILLEIMAKQTNLYVTRNSSIVEKKSAHIVSGIPHTIEELLKEVKNFDVLPSKIVLLNHDQADLIQQQLLAKNLEKDLPFLHQPQIASLEKGFENEAITRGVAKQMELSVSGDSVEEKRTIDEADIASQKTAEQLGFYKDRDIVKDPPQEKTVDENIVIPDVDNNGVEKSDDAEVYDQESQEEKHKTPFHIVALSKVSSFAKKIKSTGKTKIIAPVVALLLLILFASIYSNAIVKAEVQVTTDTQTVDEELKVSLSPTKDTSYNDKTINITVLSEKAEGELTEKATGKKETGDKATGEVTIFNKTENEKSFEKGETINSENDLTFVLLDDVKIASTAAFSESFSSKKVKVEAQSFGKEYNLPKDTNFSFEDYNTSQYFAKNESAFAGGSTKELTVVSEEDIERLEDKLTEKLTKEAWEKAKEQISDDDIIIDQAISSSLTKKQTSADPGEEAGEVKLSASLLVDIGYYSKAQLESFIQDAESVNIQENFSLSKEQSEIKLENIEKDEESITGDLKMKAVFVPKIDTENIAKNLSLKTHSSAQEELSKIEGIKKAKIIFKNTLPYIPEFFPQNPDNISVIVEADK